MIPDIGLMIGVYIITRCIDMFGQKRWTLSIMSAGTILITLICLADLVSKGTK